VVAALGRARPSLNGYLPAYTGPESISSPSAAKAFGLARLFFSIWPVGVLSSRACLLCLGRRFQRALVAIQPEHRLMTGGLYGVIRHPSYLGLFVLYAWLGIDRSAREWRRHRRAIARSLCWARIGSEERLLSEEPSATEI